MDFETELERVAAQYRSEGYAVVRRTAGDLGVELLATRGTDTVAIQVKKNRAEVEADDGLTARAAAINGRPNWRYDLVVLERNLPVRDPEEPTDEQFEELLRRVEKAKETGLNEMALTFACTSLETAMRNVRNGADPSGNATPAALGTAYANGLMTRQEFDTTRRAWELRTKAVHGLVFPPIQPAMIDDVIAVARKLRAARAA